jgi:Na+/H+ antiporter NhaA
MGMSVSLVIADITVSDAEVISQIHSGLLIAALSSAVLGLAWLKRFPVDVQ